MPNLRTYRPVSQEQIRRYCIQMHIHRLRFRLSSMANLQLRNSANNSHPRCYVRRGIEVISNDSTSHYHQRLRIRRRRHICLGGAGASTTPSRSTRSGNTHSGGAATTGTTSTRNAPTSDIQVYAESSSTPQRHRSGETQNGAEA